MTVLHRVVFTPSGLEGKVADGTTVLEAARALGADLDTVCGGRGICGRCQVTPSVGRFAKWAIDAAPGALGPPAAIEVDYHGNRPLDDGNRLGCAARIVGDVVVDVPAASQVHRQVVRKDLDLAPIVVDPSFRLYYVEVPAARLGAVESASRGAAGGGRRPARAGRCGRRSTRGCCRRCTGCSPPTTGGSPSPCTSRSVHPSTIVAVWPGYVDAAHGIAVDVGSTTIAGHLCDLGTGEVLASAGRMNPQIRFGEDLMSRVSYVMMNPGGERELTAVVRRAIDELAGELVEAAGSRRDLVLEIVLVGNPIMHHIALGIDPTPLGQAPFVLATDEAVTGRASDLDLDLPNAFSYAGPCIAGHVGADTAAAILAEGPHRGEAMQLLVDVGTNAEIVLGDRTRVFAASSPTGPAFEGAQISCGQRATAGAIERVRIDPDTLEPQIGVIGGGTQGHRRVRIGDHRRHRRDGHGRDHRRRRHHPRRAGSPHSTGRRRRAYVRLPAARRTAPHDHAERRARHPTRQGGAAGGHRAARRARRAPDRSATSAWPGRSARTSTRCGR